MKNTLIAIFAAFASLHLSLAQEKGKTTAPVAEAVPVAPVAAQRQAPKTPPLQQITSFYAACKTGEAGKGLQELLLGNPVTQEADAQRVANAFSQLIGQMGGFVDFEVIKETAISKRSQVVRCVAHLERQPFVNEFTFYDPGNGDWRLVHLRYDANLATMFQDEVRSAGK
jgi:hypothetical protein